MLRKLEHELDEYWSRYLAHHTQVGGAVGPALLQLQKDVTAGELLEAVGGERGSQEVAAQVLATLAVTTAYDDGVEVEAVAAAAEASAGLEGHDAAPATDGASGTGGAGRAAEDAGFATVRGAPTTEADNLKPGRGQWGPSRSPRLQGCPIHSS